MSDEKQDKQVFQNGLTACQDAIAVVSSVPLQVDMKGREVRAYQWLKEVEYNLKSALAKLESAPEQNPAA